MRLPGVGASNYPHQMELVCNKAFDHVSNKNSMLAQDLSKRV